MRKIIAILLAVFTVAAASEAAVAQVRIQVPAPNVMVPKIQKPPNQPRVQPVVPKVVVIPPSVALQNVMKMNPGSQALGVKLRNQTYIVRLKQGGTIKQLGVNSVTGAVTPLP
jgi:hypothetical protein